MGSDLYYAKVLDQRSFVPDWCALTRFVSHPEFGEWGYALGMPDPLIDSIADWDGLFAALSKQLEDAGAKAAIEGFSRGMFFNPELIAALADGSMAKIEKSDEFSYTQISAVTQAMLAALLPDRFAPLELAQVDVEAATMHPDAGFLKDDPLGWRARSFCLRLLTDADAEYYSDSPLYQHFERHGSDAWAQPEYGGGLDEAMGMVWMAERLRTVDLAVDDPEFWRRSADEWWAASLQGYLNTSSDNHPYQAVTYRITAPIAWLRRPLNEGVFRSRAYG